MKKVILAALAVCFAGAAHAGQEVIIAYTPIADPSGDNDVTPALILLAMVGAVIATGAMGGFATRDKTTMLPEEPDDL